MRPGRTKTSKITPEKSSASVTLRPGRSKPSDKAQASKNSLATSGYCKAWSKEEKKQLLEALKRHGVRNLDKVSDSVSSRTKAQVLTFLNRYRYNRGDAFAEEHHAPIDVWLDLLHDLHRLAPLLDLSSVLQQVFTMIAHLEPHDTDASEMTPNYQNIYLFLASLFHGEPQPSLMSPLDSLVVLDVMRSLTETFKELDLTAPTNFLRDKYFQMSSLADTKYGDYLNEVMRRASAQKDSVDGAAFIGHILLDRQNQDDDDASNNGEDECMLDDQQNDNGGSFVTDTAGNVMDDSSVRRDQSTEGMVSKPRGRRVKKKRGRKPVKPRVSLRAPKTAGVNSVSFTVNPLAVPVYLLNFER